MSGDKLSLRWQKLGMQKGRAPHTQTTKDLKKDAGERLATLAFMHQMGPTEMERCLDMTHGHFALIAKGERPLSVEKAIAVCDQFDVTLDWLFRGNASAQVHPDVLVNLVSLRPDLTERIDMVANKGTKPRAGKVSGVAGAAS